jgi:ribosomal protein S18 acetylase RimI-like enzyme
VELDSYIRTLKLKDPIKFAFEIYDFEFDRENTEFVLLNEGHLMLYRRLDPPVAILHAEREETAKGLLSKLGKEDEFILFIEPKWRGLLSFDHMKIYPEILMTCQSPIVFESDKVRPLTASDAKQVIDIYGKDRGESLAGMLRERRTTAYGLFIGDLLVSVAYTLIETDDVAVIGGVFTREGFRNRGFAASVVSKLAYHVAKGGKTASLYVREDNKPAIRVYEKIGFKEYLRRFWVSVNTNAKPL